MLKLVVVISLKKYAIFQMQHTTQAAIQFSYKNIFTQLMLKVMFKIYLLLELSNKYILQIKTKFKELKHLLSKIFLK